MEKSFAIQSNFIISKYNIQMYITKSLIFITYTILNNIWTMLYFLITSNNIK